MRVFFLPILLLFVSQSLIFVVKVDLMENTSENSSKGKELNKLFCSKAFYSDRLDLSRKVLQIYNSMSVIFDWPKISPRHLDLIAYYVCYGYNENTQKRYVEDFRVSSSTMSVMNCELKNIGLLVDIGGNFRTRNLCPRLQRFRQYFAGGDPGPKTLVIEFIRKDVAYEE